MPFPTKIPASYEAHRPYTEALGDAGPKRGVRRTVTLTREDRLPMNLGVLRRPASDGRLMVVAITHDATEAPYEVTEDPGLRESEGGGVGSAAEPSCRNRDQWVIPSFRADLGSQGVRDRPPQGLSNPFRRHRCSSRRKTFPCLPTFETVLTSMSTNTVQPFPHRPPR